MPLCCEANGINNEGQIVANGYGYGPNGFGQRAFLLTPVAVPEPGTLHLILGALVVCTAKLLRSHRVDLTSKLAGALR
jgi:hypothetical protein